MIGGLRHRLTFYKRAAAADAYGNREGAWEEQFTVAAGKRWLRGREEVLAQRLQGVQPVILTIRQSSDTRQISTAWKAIDRDGSEYAVKSVTPIEGKPYFDLLCEIGPAKG